MTLHNSISGELFQFDVFAASRAVTNSNERNAITLNVLCYFCLFSNEYNVLDVNFFSHFLATISETIKNKKNDVVLAFLARRFSDHTHSRLHHWAKVEHFIIETNGKSKTILEKINNSSNLIENPCFTLYAFMFWYFYSVFLLLFNVTRSNFFPLAPIMRHQHFIAAQISNNAE